MQPLTTRKHDTTTSKRLITRSRLFFYVFSLLIFGFVIIYSSEIRREFRMLKNLNSYWLLVAFLLQLLTYLFNAFVYRILMRVYQVPHIPSLKEFYKVSVVSLFFNQTIPSAGISGNTFFFSYLQKKNVSSPVILSLIFSELSTFYVAMEFIILLFTALSFFNRWPNVFCSVLLTGFLVYMLFGIATILTGRKKTFDLLYRRLGRWRLFKPFFQTVQSDFKNMNLNKNSFQLIPLLKDRPAAFIKAFFLQLLLFTTDLFTVVVLFNGLGVPVSILAVALSLICTKIISVFPFSPGSLILYESSMSFFFVKMGIALAPSIAVTLIYRLLSFWLPIPAGLLLYRRWLNTQNATQ